MTNRQFFFLFAISCIDVILAAPGWRDGRATFYGNEHWLWDIHQGSCGYGYLCPEEGTGWDITALPDIHPEYSGSCGRCYEIKCRPSTFTDNYGNFLERTQLYNTCKEPDASVVVTVTDTCPCHYAENFYSNQRWCCGDMDHLDISVWAFEKLADLKWGVIGLSYREVPCDHQPSKPAKPLASPYPPAPKPEGITCPRGNFPLRQKVMNLNSVRDSLLMQSGVVTAFAVSSDFVYSEDQPEIVLDHVNSGGVTVDNAQSFFDHLGNQYDVVDEDTVDDQKERVENADDAKVQLSIVAQAQPEDHAITITYENEKEQEEDEDNLQDINFAKVALAATRSIFVDEVDESASIYTKPDEVESQSYNNDQSPEVSPSPSTMEEDDSIEISVPEASSSSKEVVLFQDGFDSDWQVLSFSAEVWEAPGSGVNGGTALCSKIYNGGRLQFYGDEGLFNGQRAVEFWLATDNGVPNIMVNVGKDGKSCNSQEIQSLSQSGQLGAFSRYEITQEMFENNNSEFSNDKSCDFQQSRSMFISNNAQYDTWMCIDEVKLLK